MKYLLFNWEMIDAEVSDPSELTDKEFEELAKQDGGFVIHDTEEFISRFNAEHINSTVHQLRIVE